VLKSPLCHFITPGPPDDESRLALWFSSASASVPSADQSALELRVALAEQKRWEGIEQRRKKAQDAADAAKAEASSSVQQFYKQREDQLAAQR